MKVCWSTPAQAGEERCKYTHGGRLKDAKLPVHRDPLEKIGIEFSTLEQERHFSVPGLGLIGPHVCGIAVR